jgi:hypothetical protein
MTHGHSPRINNAARLLRIMAASVSNRRPGLKTGNKDRKTGVTDRVMNAAGDTIIKLKVLVGFQKLRLVLSV